MNLLSLFSFHSYYNSISFIDMGKGITANDLTINDLSIMIHIKPAYMRIKMLQYTTMLQLFSEVMDDYNASSLKYQEKCQSFLRRQRSLSTYSRKIYILYIPITFVAFQYLQIFNSYFIIIIKFKL